MYNKLIFFSHVHAGDLFESKEFVRDICTQVDAKEIYYTHGQNQRIFLDLPYIKQNSEFLNMMNSGTATLDINGDFWVNTWIGRDRNAYVLPGSGCTIEMLYRMYIDMGFKLRSDIYSYIPSIDFNYYKIGSIQEHLKTVDNKNKVLICSGPTHSLQAENFDFAPIVLKLAVNFPDVIFYITSQLFPRKESVLRNVFYTKDIIGDLDCDLNEIGYLAKFCDLIIGRCSGPSVFAENRDVYMDETKTLLSFTFTNENSHFVLNDILPAKRLWSPASDTNSVYEKIVSTMKERSIV